MTESNGHVCDRHKSPESGYSHIASESPHRGLFNYARLNRALLHEDANHRVVALVLLTGVVSKVTRVKTKGRTLRSLLDRRSGQQLLQGKLRSCKSFVLLLPGSLDIHSALTRARLIARSVGATPRRHRKIRPETWAWGIQSSLKPGTTLEKPSLPGTRLLCPRLVFLERSLELGGSMKQTEKPSPVVHTTGLAETLVAPDHISPRSSMTIAQVFSILYIADHHAGPCFGGGLESCEHGFMRVLN